MKKSVSKIAITKLESNLFIQEGRFYLGCRGGVQVEVTQHQAQMIQAHSPSFIIELDCHRLDERVFGKDLVKRMHQAFEERQRDDFRAGVCAAIALLEDQPG